jgi:hypothetical protein
MSSEAGVSALLTAAGDGWRRLVLDKQGHGGGTSGPVSTWTNVKARSRELIEESMGGRTH